MGRKVASAWRTSYGIGLSCGLAAGMVGIAQWILTARDLVERLAAFRAAQREFPGFGDATNVVRGNEWYWVGTATLAFLTILVICLLAAFLAGWALKRRRDGEVAAWVAAAVSSAVYVLASLVAMWTSPAPDMTQSVVPCGLIFELALACIVVVLAPAGAGIGAQASGFFSHGRSAL